MLYTDEVTEAMNTKNQQFGRERLETLVRQAKQMPVKEVIEKIRLSLEEFSEGKPLDEDTTIVVSRIA